MLPPEDVNEVRYIVKLERPVAEFTIDLPRLFQQRPRPRQLDIPFEHSGQVVQCHRLCVAVSSFTTERKGILQKYACLSFGNVIAQAAGSEQYLRACRLVAAAARLGECLH